MKKLHCLAFCLLAGWLATAVLAAERVVKMPGLSVYTGQDPRLEIPAKVATTNGILEFILVEKESRDYESVFSTTAKPSILQAALFGLGAETGSVQRSTATVKAGTSLNIEVEWVLNGTTNRLPVEKVLIDRKTKQPPADLPWVFNGSFFTIHPITSNRVFQADAEQAHIALWWQPAIPVNIGGDFGNPYKDEALGFEVNTALVPPKGTPVTIHIRKRTK
jgi:hypothetical protein